MKINSQAQIMSLLSNNSHVDLSNSQPNVAPGPKTVINNSALLAVLQQPVVLPNQGVGLALAVHANTGLSNLSGITVTY